MKPQILAMRYGFAVFLFICTPVICASDDRVAFSDPGVQEAHDFLSRALDEKRNEDVRFGLWQIGFELRRCDAVYGKAFAERARLSTLPLVKRANDSLKSTLPMRLTFEVRDSENSSSLLEASLVRD